MRKVLGLFGVLLVLVVSVSCAVDEAAPGRPMPAPMISSLDELADIDGVTEITGNPAFEQQELGHILCYEFLYENDGFEIYAYVTAPDDYMEKTYPVLVYNFGGNAAMGKFAPTSPGALADKGYIVLATQYRGVGVVGGRDGYGGEDINDIIKMIDLSEHFAFAQPGGVYMVGHSRGGSVTYSACRRDDRIAAAAVIAGYTDLAAAYYERDAVMQNKVLIPYVGGSPEKVPEEYEKRSAVKWADEIDVPLLIMHGADDDRVLVHHATDMAEKLEEYGKDYKLLVYEGEGHSFTFDYRGEVKSWFDAHPIGSGR
ncbi:MAG: prolyl oligopeptidase family serine peptidase [Oscillospiraceae bacterium]|jgi:dipeptidyl aminopeptidase/acylaminoacyl peptidase|nr:prolyl oligopeptidase family serine peptidase [Oscillospiraceae bacterium]